MKPLNIVVVGTMACDPYAGMAWMHMQIVAGLQRLGHNVWYFETTSVWPYDPVLDYRVNNVNYSVPYLKRVAERFGLKGRWAYRCSFLQSMEWIGISKSKAEDMLLHADAVLNISGATRFEVDGLKVGRLVYYGTDPVYQEIRYAQGDKEARSIVDEHDDVITYGENIGNPDCLIPPLPRMRGRTRQPVLTDMWRNGKPTRQAFTTVGNWKQGGRDLQFNGEVYYWSKHHEFLKFLDIPLRTTQPLEVAMNINTLKAIGEGTQVPSFGLVASEYEMLTSNGWVLRDGPALSTDPWKYQEYIFSSRAEFSFAKDQNIRLRSGWFSERSACYLAAGRPVVTQDTAFNTVLPTGEGLFAFNTMDEALAAVEAINSDYERHSNAAREIAEEYFKAEKVLAKVINDLSL